MIVNYSLCIVYMESIRAMYPQTGTIMCQLNIKRKKTVNENGLKEKATKLLVYSDLSENCWNKHLEIGNNSFVRKRERLVARYYGFSVFSCLLQHHSSYHSVVWVQLIHILFSSLHFEKQKKNMHVLECVPPTRGLWAPGSLMRYKHLGSMHWMRFFLSPLSR